MKTELELQNENIQRLIALTQQHPERRIVPMVSSEVVHDDGYSSWAGQWEKASLEEVWHDDERIYFKSEDEDELIDQMADNLSFEPEHKHRTEEELYQIATLKVHKYDWEKVIVVNINAT